MTGPRRGPGVSEAAHAGAVAGVLARQEKARTAKAAEDTEVEARLREADALGLDTTPAAIRQALAHRSAEEAEAKRKGQAETARRIIADAPSDEPPDGRLNLSRADVIRARRGWQRGEGHPWKLAGVSKATYLRARHRYRLVPWPPKYRDKLTP